MAQSGSSIRWPSVITVVSAAILIGTELVGAAYACGWALANLLELGDKFGWVFQGVLTVIALYVVYKFIRQAIRAEPLTG